VPEAILHAAQHFQRISRLVIEDILVPRVPDARSPEMTPQQDVNLRLGEYTRDAANVVFKGFVIKQDEEDVLLNAAATEDARHAALRTFKKRQQSVGAYVKALACALRVGVLFHSSLHPGQGAMYPAPAHGGRHYEAFHPSAQRCIKLCLTQTVGGTGLNAFIEGSSKMEQVRHRDVASSHKGNKKR